MSRFGITDLPLAGLKLVERQNLGDSRGWFSRLYCSKELATAGFVGPIAQVNVSHTTTRGTVRGLHFQTPPHVEMKLVSCLRGRVWDVAVDLRRGSETFLHWHGEELSADNRRALLVPEGFAHGFQTLTDGVELLYCHSTAHEPRAEAGLHPCDPALGIDWPIDISELSDRDVQQPPIDAEFSGLMI